MKVERKQEKKFEPITITIETEEEAICMWHRLNAGRISLGDYYRQFPNSHIVADSNMNYGMWESYNKTFRPELK